MTRWTRIALITLAVVWPALALDTVESAAQDESAVRLTVVLRGVVNEADAEALRVVLNEFKYVEYDPADVRQGERGPFGHFFSPPVPLTLTDLNQTDIGEIASAIADAQTPSRREVVPYLNLVLYHPFGFIDEDDIIGLREALRGTNGLLIDEPGGLGGVPSEGRFWVRLDAGGGANLIYIQQAIGDAGLNFSLLPR